MSGGKPFSGTIFFDVKATPGRHERVFCGIGGNDGDCQIKYIVGVGPSFQGFVDEVLIGADVQPFTAAQRALKPLRSAVVGIVELTIDFKVAKGASALQKSLVSVPAIAEIDQYRFQIDRFGTHIGHKAMSLQSMPGSLVDEDLGPQSPAVTHKQNLEIKRPYGQRCDTGNGANGAMVVLQPSPHGPIEVDECPQRRSR